MAEAVVFSQFNVSNSGKLQGVEIKHFIAFEYLMDDMRIKAEDIEDSKVELFLNELGCAGKDGCSEEDFVKVLLQSGKSVEDMQKLEAEVQKYFKNLSPA